MMFIEEQTFSENDSVAVTPPEPAISIFSQFSELQCGEPSLPHRLTFDFTPTEELDNDYVQKKCCKFWNFVASQPSLQSFVVLTEKKSKMDTQTTEMISESGSIQECNTKTLTTAISMIKLAGDAGQVQEAFESKLAVSQCSLRSREYIDDETMIREAEKKGFKPNPECKCSTNCPCNRHRRFKAPEYSTKAVKRMCTNFHTWDEVHPKSFDPPAHPPEAGPSLEAFKIEGRDTK